MNVLRALLVDDERLARDELRTLLADFPEVEIVGEAANATEALHRVPALKPDLMFLDIEMPRMNGFALLEQLSPAPPHVIFTTAYDAFALQAFEVNALDYLLKPIHPARLSIALSRASDRINTLKNSLKEPAAASTRSAENALYDDDRVFVREGDRCWFVPVRSIQLLEAEGNHTRVHFESFQPVLYRTLLAMEERLPPRLFVRANRSQLVNTTFIESVQPWFSGSLKVTLRGGSTIEFSRRQALIFRDRLSL
jgi:two-component system LytT family response regulator